MPTNLRALIPHLTLAEKASLMSGANFWNTTPIDRVGIPAIMLTDGPHGLRKQGGAADHLGLNASVPATCFPSAATLANSWDLDLLERVGAALGAEAAAEGVSVVLGPGLNIKRNPLAGRNFEYFSEDPYVSGRLASAYIRGLQSRGVAACAKHFAVNSQETHRMSIDEVVDERALHEIYLEGFRLAVDEGDAWTVMSSYNKVNGTYANENTELLSTTLRQRWGFTGLVVTDWGGNNDRVAGLIAGNALEMPSANGVTDREIVRAVQDGALDEEILDARVGELLDLIDKTCAVQATPIDSAVHHEHAIDAARRSIVLLANPHRVLPLGAEAGRIAVIGDFARTPRYQGAGSSLVNPTRVDSLLDALTDTDLSVIGFKPGFTRRDGSSRRLRAAALALAAQADTVVLFLGLDESAEAEAVDRQHLRLARNQLALTEELISLGKRIVVVLAGGAPIEIPFADRVDAIVHSYLPGQGGGRAIADVLTGAVNPSGKLTETYPLRYADIPSSTDFTKTEASAEHRESIYVGYRYFDKIGAAVRYPFGHGLSYTTFAYSDLRATGNQVTVTVTNTGDRSGEDIVQVYIEAPDAALGQFRAVRELRGFAKLALDPGARRTVTIDLSTHAFEAWDTQAHDWQAIPGRYSVLLGASSRDIRLRTEVTIDAAPWQPSAAGLEPYLTGEVTTVSPAQFEALCARALPPTDWARDAPLTRDDIVAQTQDRGGFAGLLHRIIMLTSRALMTIGRPHAANNVRFALDLPFRSISRLSGGLVTDAMLDALLLMVNGRFWRGTRNFIRATWTRCRTPSRTITE